MYVVSPEKKKIVREIKSALKEADELIIATDEDREGESIGWHLVQLLEPKVPVKRMVFSEITKDAILNAIEHPRDLDEDLVQAQETRRVVDRLVRLRTQPAACGGRSNPSSPPAACSPSPSGCWCSANSNASPSTAGPIGTSRPNCPPTAAAASRRCCSPSPAKKIATGKDFDEHTGKIKEGVDVLLLAEQEARDLQNRIREQPWTVQKIEERSQTRKPAPPFTTSSLQMEANRKLNMSTRQTMQVAQRLYENGHITYMRTDSVNLSQEALNAARNCVRTRYGEEYLSPEPRQYTNKAKNAQEAHEAIRPAGTEMLPAKELGLSGDEFKLYELIWKRTVATQMAEARLTFQTVTIQAEDAEFRASGRHVDFPGFFRAYVEGSDDPEAALDDQESALPPLKGKPNPDRPGTRSPQPRNQAARPLHGSLARGQAGRAKASAGRARIPASSAPFKTAATSARTAANSCPPSPRWPSPGSSKTISPTSSITSSPPAWSRRSTTSPPAKPSGCLTSKRFTPATKAWKNRSSKRSKSSTPAKPARCSSTV